MVRFDLHSELETIQSGDSFWCSGCISARPVAERSADSRYCQGCHDFLCREADSSPKNQRGGWVPMDWVPKVPATASAVVGCSKIADIGNHTTGIIATPIASEGNGKGRHKTDLPLAKIKELREKGYGSRKIAEKLASEGIEVHFTTIARALKESQGGLL